MSLPACKPLTVARVHQGLSLCSLAREIDVDKAHLSRIEAGRIKASPDLADRLQKFFGGTVTRDQILFPEDYPHFKLAKKPSRSVRVQEVQ